MPLQMSSVYPATSSTVSSTVWSSSSVALVDAAAGEKSFLNARKHCWTLIVFNKALSQEKVFIAGRSQEVENRRRFETVVRTVSQLSIRAAARFVAREIPNSPCLHIFWYLPCYAFPSLKYRDFQQWPVITQRCFFSVDAQPHPLSLLWEPDICRDNSLGWAGHMQVLQTVQKSIACHQESLCIANDNVV